MKRTLFLISMVFATTIIFSQNYFVKFEAKGLTTIVDSVKVENLTQLTKMTVTGVDVLHLTGSVGINNLSQNEGTAIVNPNPMQGHAELLFYAKHAGNVRIIIYDIAGKDVVQISGKLSAGVHKYSINGLKEGSYVINILGTGYQYNVKLISKNSFQSKASIKYLGSIKQEGIIKTFKNTRSTVDMAYKIGDSLRFTGYSGIYLACVNDVPIADKTITFTFLALPDISTTAISAITDTSAVSGGNITLDGGVAVTSRGVCWGGGQNPTLANSFTINNQGTGSYASNINGLMRNTLYYVRAYATNSLGTAYGNELSFITNNIPSLTTTAISAITDTSAVSGGNITSDGGDAVTSRGVCWGTSQNPNLANSFSSDSTGIGSYSSKLSGLMLGTTYYIRAYATNSIGTAYGNEFKFTTINIPSLSTKAITSITDTTAISGGNITADGGGSVTARGVCWGTAQNPTLASNFTTDNSGIGSYVTKLTGLSPKTKYFIRAYATNFVGTAYGNLDSFTTTMLTLITVQIPAGTFTMGSPTSEVNRNGDETQYQVTVSSFKLSKYEITNAQYAAFLNDKGIGSNGLYAAGAYPTQALLNASSGGYDWGLHYKVGQWTAVAGFENHPIINVTWYGATEFATYVGGRLPTEAEWEYACRGNTTTPFNTGACLSNAQANYDWLYPYNTCTNTNTIFPGKTQGVGAYSANAFGLYDMHGNVWEWCSDWYGTYPTTPQTNPTGATTGSNRIFRGASWDYNAFYCRSAFRNKIYPNYFSFVLGFRVVIVP